MTSLSRYFCDQTLLRPDIALSKHCCAQTLVHPGADESRRCGVWSTGSNRHHFLTAIGELGELKTQLRPDADTLWAGLIKQRWWRSDFTASQQAIAWNDVGPVHLCIHAIAGIEIIELMLFFNRRKITYVQNYWDWWQLQSRLNKYVSW